MKQLYIGQPITVHGRRGFIVDTRSWNPALEGYVMVQFAVGHTQWLSRQNVEPLALDDDPEGEHEPT